MRHCNAILFFPNAQLSLDFLEVADIYKDQQIGALGKITQSFANAFDPQIGSITHVQPELDLVFVRQFLPAPLGNVLNIRAVRRVNDILVGKWLIFLWEQASQQLFDILRSIQRSLVKPYFLDDHSKKE